MKGWIAQRALDVIEQEASRRRMLETGGPIFGYQTGSWLEGHEPVIAIAYGPGPRAKHRPTTLEPDRAATQAAIDFVYQQTEACYRFLGSWHSHPGGSARPSGRDIATARAIAHEEAVELPNPLILIQATARWSRGSRIGDLAAFRWSGVASGLVPVELEITELDDGYV